MQKQFIGTYLWLLMFVCWPVGHQVDWFVGRSVDRLVCHNFHKRSKSYTFMLLSDYLLLCYLVRQLLYKTYRKMRIYGQEINLRWEFITERSKEKKERKHAFDQEKK